MSGKFNTPAAPTEAPTDMPAPTPNTISVEITPENFKQYFDVSVDVSSQTVSNESYSFGIKSLDLSGNVTLSIVSKIPCELHNVEFSITAAGGAYIGLANTEEKIYCSAEQFHRAAPTHLQSKCPSLA